MVRIHPYNHLDWICHFFNSYRYRMQPLTRSCSTFATVCPTQCRFGVWMNASRRLAMWSHGIILLIKQEVWNSTLHIFQQWPCGDCTCGHQQGNRDCACWGAQGGGVPAQSRRKCFGWYIWCFFKFLISFSKKVGSYAAITSNGALVAAKTPPEVQRELSTLSQVPVLCYILHENFVLKVKFFFLRLLLEP